MSHKRNFVQLALKFSKRSKKEWEDLCTSCWFFCSR